MHNKSVWQSVKVGFIFKLVDVRESLLQLIIMMTAGTLGVLMLASCLTLMVLSFSAALTEVTGKDKIIA